MLLGHKGTAHEADGGNGANVTGDLQGTYLFLYVFAVEVGVGAPRLGIELEGDADVGHLFLKGFCLHTAVTLEESLVQGIEGDATVHGTGIDIDVTDLTGQILGHRALTARTVAVDGYGNLFHKVYDALNNRL